MIRVYINGKQKVPFREYCIVQTIEFGDVNLKQNDSIYINRVVDVGQNSFIRCKKVLTFDKKVLD